MRPEHLRNRVHQSNCGTPGLSRLRHHLSPGMGHIPSQAGLLKR